MAVDPGQDKRPFPEELPVAWGLIRRDLENDDWYRGLVEHSRDLLCVHDLEGRFLSVNPGSAHLLGYSVEELLRTPMREFVDPQFHSQFDTYLREIEQKGESCGLLAVLTRSGEQRIWEYHNTLQTRGVVKPIVRGIAHDVTERVRAEQALRVSNQKLLKTAREREQTLQELTLFRMLLDQSNDAIEVVDPQTLRLLDVNDRCCQELGYSREELLSMTIFDIDPNVDEERRARVERQLQESGFIVLETTHRRKDRTTFPVEVNVRRVRLDREYAVAVARNITARVQTEKALQISNEKLLKTAHEQERILQELTLFRTLLDQSNDSIKVIDLQSLRFLDVNERAYLELGYSREELLSMTVRDIDPSVDENLLTRVRQQLRESGSTIFETTHRRKDGSLFPVEVNMRQVRLDREYCVSISRDITTRKRAEERLREFERVVESLEQMIVVLDREHRYMLANRAFLNYRGVTRELIIGRFVGDILGRELYEGAIKPKLDECFWGTVVSFEHRCHYPGIGERDLAVTYLLVENGSGIDRAACVIRDVTEQKRAEEALRESEVRERARAKELETVLEAVPAAVCIAHDPECRSITGNRAAHELMRVPAGKNFSKSAPPEEQPRLRLLTNGVEVPPDLLPMQQTAATGKAIYGCPLTLVFEDGTERETLVNAVSLLDETGKPRGAVGASIDLTELKLTEEALRQNELLFRTVYERSPIGIALVDSRTGRFLRVNPKYCEIAGRNEEELLQLDLASITHPEDLRQSNENLRQMMEEKLSNYELDKRLIRPDGSVRWIRVLVVPMWGKGETRRWHMGLVQDITERRNSEEAIATLMQQVCEAKKKLAEEKLYLEHEIDTELGFEEIIGQSKALQSVMEQVGKVASSDATVLLLGETGTGKELVARAIHRLSRRSNSSFIKMNCAAIPSGLLESELFGNEKGAFTDAVSKKIGRLELADRGTLFLDEIGEISLPLQPKLLRVLQDQEFERLGGTQTLKVDFRLIAATNRDLADSVQHNEFRRDLYYRLNVFPIRVPPLRERREDIRLLVEHFVQKFARRMNKSIASLPWKTMDALTQWEWPGNVRELENFIERSVILTQGSVLVSPLSELKRFDEDPNSVDESLEAAERAHIMRALRESDGQIGGPRGAAMRLGLKRTTLQSKLKQLGINPRPASPGN